MGKGSKIGCKMASHQLFKDKAKNWVDDLQGMFTDLQFARKESRSIDVAMLEEQVHQMLHEWKAELDEASPAPSLPVKIIIWNSLVFVLEYDEFQIFLFFCFDWKYLGRGIIVLPLPICLRIYDKSHYLYQTIILLSNVCYAFNFVLTLKCMPWLLQQ